MGRLLTSSEILRRACTPEFEAQVATGGADRGCLFVNVTGVPKPFSFKVAAENVKGAAPFGRPTTESVRRLARELAIEACRNKGYL
jgi:hypothetical protein